MGKQEIEALEFREAIESLFERAIEKAGLTEAVAAVKAERDGEA
jgi:hypothetical protein